MNRAAPTSQSKTGCSNWQMMPLQPANAEAAETGFAKAGALLDDVLDNPTGQKMKDGTDNLLAKGGPMLSSGLGRNLAIGAGAGAVAGLVLPFVGTLFGAAVGAGLGYLRTITKK